jgi:hypothetical protein
MSNDNPAPWLETYSVPVVPEGERFVMLSGLAETYKRAAWTEISKNHPALATLLREPDLKMIMEMFDADLFVEAFVAPMLPPERLKGRNRAES